MSLFCQEYVDQIKALSQRELPGLFTTTIKASSQSLIERGTKQRLPDEFIYWESLTGRIADLSLIIQYDLGLVHLFVDPSSDCIQL